MFEARISAGAKEKHLQELQGNLMQKSYLLGPMTLEGHAKKCAQRFCEFANKTTQQSVQSPNTQSAHKLFSNVCIWLVLGDLMFYGL